MEEKTASGAGKIDKNGFLEDVRVDLTYKNMIMDKDYPNGQMVKHRLYKIREETIVI